MKIFVNIPEGFRNNSFITPAIKDYLKKVGEVTYNNSSSPLGGDELGYALKDADVVITGWGQPIISKENIGNVKLIVHTGGTVGGIVDIGVFDLGVTVISGNNYYAESVAEGTLSYMLYALRNMGHYGSIIKNGEWTWEARTEGLIGQSVGIVSYGAISSRLIPKLRLFTDKIKVYSTHEDEALAKREGFSYATLDEIFSTCKIVSVHTAKNPETYHMINKKHFDMLRDGALFINTSRGAVIDEQALIEALKENRFKALLDVYETEPLKEDNELRSLSNVMLFPHMAGPTYDMRERITGYLIDDIVRFEKGEKLRNEITKEVAIQMTIV